MERLVVSSTNRGGRWSGGRVKVWEKVTEFTPFLIPTASKGKISHLLSFPIGAQEISKALTGAPQLGFLQIRFHASNGDGRSFAGELLRVEYWNGVEPECKWPIHTIYPRPVQHRWEIIVHPVYRESRREVKEYLISQALPTVRDWLLRRGNQEVRGSEILAFFSDRARPSGFVTHSLSKVEPLRKKI